MTALASNVYLAGSPRANPSKMTWGRSALSSLLPPRYQPQGRVGARPTNVEKYRYAWVGVQVVSPYLALFRPDKGFDYWVTFNH